jgi:glycosyltransferase involved in cell wall biosynthesis
VHNLRISLITVSYNAESTFERCIQSVIQQDYDNVEYIIIDGASTDATVAIARKYADQIDVLVSEPDKGIYDAMNKGIAIAKGDVIGILNADDFFVNNTVLSTIAGVFMKNDPDIVYGDLNYINAEGKVVRKWRSGQYKKGFFNLGWMPPHPTFYCKKELFNSYGNYSLHYGTAADYELMLRFIHPNYLSVTYVQKVFVNMTIGGVSNNTYKNRIRSLFFDLKAMYNNKLFFPPMTLFFKPLRKISQFLNFE